MRTLHYNEELVAGRIRPISWDEYINNIEKRDEGSKVYYKPNDPSDRRYGKTIAMLPYRSQEPQFWKKMGGNGETAV